MRYKKKRALQSESKAGSKWRLCWMTNQHTHPPSKSNCEVAKVRAAVSKGSIWRSGDHLACSRKSLSQYPFRTPIKDSTTTFYQHCSNTRSPYRVPSNNKRDECLTFDSSADAADKLLYLHHFKQDSCLFNRKIFMEMLFLRSAQRYSTSCTLFTSNTMVESFRASLLSYLIKLKLFTEVWWFPYQN